MISLIAIVCIGLLLMTYLWTKDKYQQKFDVEMKAYHQEHNYKIRQLEEDFKKLSTAHDTLKTHYENALNYSKHYQSLYHDALKQKVKAENQTAKLQKALYCARKRSKKLVDRLKGPIE